MSELSITDTGSFIDEVLASIDSPTETSVAQTSPEVVAPTDSVSETATTTGQIPETHEQVEQVPEDSFTAPGGIVDQLLSTIVPLTELQTPLVTLIYGDPKTGKTVTSCAHKEMTLFINIENGAISLKNHPELVFQDGKQRIQVMDFQSYRQLLALAEALKRGYLPEYKVIVLDTWSSLYKYDLDLIVDHNVKKINENNANPVDRDLYTPQGDKDYQPVINRMARLATAFAECGRDIVFVCHQKEEKTRRGDITQIRPDLSPTLARTMYKLASVIGWQHANTDNSGTHRFLQVQPDTTVVAGTRVGGLPNIISNPTLHEIMQAHHNLNESLKMKEGN